MNLVIDSSLYFSLILQVKVKELHLANDTFSIEKATGMKSDLILIYQKYWLLDDTNDFVLGEVTSKYSFLAVDISDFD